MSEKPLLETCRAWVVLLIQPSCAGSRIGLGKERRRTNSRHVNSWMGLWATWSSWSCPCSLQGGWARWPLKVPSNPKHSMILPHPGPRGGWAMFCVSTTCWEAAGPSAWCYGSHHAIKKWLTRVSSDSCWDGSHTSRLLSCKRFSFYLQSSLSRRRDQRNPGFEKAWHTIIFAAGAANASFDTFQTDALFVL